MLNASLGVVDPQSNNVWLSAFQSTITMFQLHGLKVCGTIPLTITPVTTGSYLQRERERERERVNRIKEHISSYRWKCTPAKTLLFVSEISQITGCKLSLLWSHIEAWGASSGLQYYLKLGPETLVAHQHPVIAQLQPIWARCEIWSVKFKYTIAWYF